MFFVVPVVLTLTLQVSLSGKVTLILLAVGLIKKIQLYKTSCFPEPHIHSKKKEIDFFCVIVRQNLFLKNATGVDTSDFTKNTDLANLQSDASELDTAQLKNMPSGSSNLKSKIYKLDVHKLVLDPVDLNKLSVQ